MPSIVYAVIINHVDTIAKSDVFFFITTIAVIAISVIFAVVLIYVVKILRDIKDISGIAKDQTKSLSGDLDELRTRVKKKGQGWMQIYGHFADFFRKKKGRK